MFALVVITVLISAAAGKYTGPTNQAGVNLIKQFEGFEPNFYNDAVGIKTIGYGHACHSFPCSVPIYGQYSVPLSQASGEGILTRDLKVFETCVNGAVTYPNLNADQYSALVSFTFNLGCANLKSSTLLKKLNAGDVAGTSGEFGKWVNAGGKRLEGLVRRREAERKLFCSDGACGGTEGGSGSGTTSCTGTATTELRVRSSPNTSGTIVGSLASGQTTTIRGRQTGTTVNGNSNWFKLPNGYVSAYYMNIASSNGEAWCSNSDAPRNF